MTEDLAFHIRKYRSQGLLIDTNILLLYFVGSLDRSLIARFKRTCNFTADDWDLLAHLLAHFDRIVTTPNILTETSNLAGQLVDPLKTVCFSQIAATIQVLVEDYVKSKTVATARDFARFGLTDLSIREAARNQYLVLTDDLRLSVHLTEEGIDVINFNHLRYFE